MWSMAVCVVCVCGVCACVCVCACMRVCTQPIKHVHVWNVLSDLLTFLQDGGLADLATGVSGQIDHQRLEMIKPLLWRGGRDGGEEWRRDEDEEG